MRRITVLVGLLSLACGTHGLDADAGKGRPLDLPTLIAALRQAGASVASGDQVSQPFFSVKGRILRVNGEDVQVFAYRDEPSAQREAGQVSADGGTVGTTKVGWMAPPHFYRKGLLIVLYVGDTAAVKDALRAVLGPQFAGQ
jgi:5-enolpyruvylshikimate-3-phosphate synthase